MVEKEQIKELETKLAEQLEAQKNLPKEAARSLDLRIDRLTDELQKSKDRLDVLMKEMTQVRAMVSLVTPKVRISQKATINEEPIHPNVRLIIILSAFSGALISALFYGVSGRLFHNTGHLID